MDKRQELTEKLGLIFGELEKTLIGIRHPGNTIELTESYKKMKELGLWLTLALSIDSPSFSQTNTSQPREVKFGKKNKQRVANT